MLRVVATDRAPLLYAVGVAVVVTAAHELFDVAHLALPFAPIGTLGAAVAIFAAFASMPPTPGGRRGGCSGRRIQDSDPGAHTPADGRHHELGGEGAATPEATAAYRREMAGRLIAFAYVLGALLAERTCL